MLRVLGNKEGNMSEAKVKPVDVGEAKNLPSGRWIFTVVAAAVLGMFGALVAGGLCVMLCMNKLAVAVILAIFSQINTTILLVANWYFQRQDRANDGTK